MACPDLECNLNVKDLKKDIKCLPKKVGRKELWGGIGLALIISVPMFFTYASTIGERLTMVEKSIIAIQEQQKKIDATVYQAVRDAIKDAIRDAKIRP